MNIALAPHQLKNLETFLWHPGGWKNPLGNKLWVLARDAGLDDTPVILDITVDEYYECLERLTYALNSRRTYWTPIITELIDILKEHELGFAVEEAIEDTQVGAA